MKRISSVLILFLALVLHAQVYTNWPSHLSPVATPFSAYWTLNATDSVSGLSLLGGSTNGTSGANTNLSNISSAATNVILSISAGSATNAIALNNGFGTNTTLISGKNITTTNISVLGTTYLNYSNLNTYSFGTAIGQIPAMTGSNLPSGLASASSEVNGNESWVGFAQDYSWWQSDGLTNTVFLEYAFPTSTVLISSVYAPFRVITGPGTGAGSTLFQYSLNNSTWTTLYSATGTNGEELTFIASFPPVAVKYVRTIFYHTNDATIGGGFQVYYTNFANILASSNQLQIMSTNGGVLINTNSNQGNFALAIHGGINVDDNYYINGLPIGQNVAPVQNAGLTVLSVTNYGAGAFTNFNGNYYSATQTRFYFTNLYGSWIQPGVYSGAGFSWPDYTLENAGGTIVFILTNGAAGPSSPVGIYSGILGSGTNTPIVSYPVNNLPFASTNYLQAGAGGNLDGESITNIAYTNVVNVPSFSILPTNGVTTSKDTNTTPGVTYLYIQGVDTNALKNDLTNQALALSFSGQFNGNPSGANGTGSEAFGIGANASGTYDVSVGQSTTGSGSNQTAVGYSAQVYLSALGGTAIGHNSTVSGAEGTAIGDGAGAGAGEVRLGGTGVTKVTSPGTFIGIFSGDGSSLTNLTGSAIASGTVATNYMAQNLAAFTNLQAAGISTNGSSAGQVLTSTGGNTVWSTPSAGSAGPAVSITNAAPIGVTGWLVQTNSTGGLVVSNSFFGTSPLTIATNGVITGNGGGVTNLGPSAITVISNNLLNALTVAANTNTYVQVVVQNMNTNGAAETGFYINQPGSTSDTSNFFGAFYNSPNYTNFAAGGSTNDAGWIYTQASGQPGNLDVFDLSTNSSVKFYFATASNPTTNLVLTFNTNGIAGNGNGLTNLSGVPYLTAFNTFTSSNQVQQLFFSGVGSSYAYLTNGTYAAGRVAVRVGGASINNYGNYDATGFELFNANNETREAVFFDSGVPSLQYLTSNGRILFNGNSTIRESGGYGVQVDDGATTQLTNWSAQAYLVLSNTWNLNAYTNKVPNFATIRDASSNGTPVSIYMSNGVPFIYYEAVQGGGLLP